MKLFIGSDHRGFQLKTDLISYLQSKDIRIEDFGNYSYDVSDDYPDYSKAVAKAVAMDGESRGIVICGSGIGAAVQANRFKHIRCGLAFNEAQVQHGRQTDQINMMSLPADYIDFETAKKLVDIFLSTPGLNEDRYIRRINKLDQ